MAALAWTRMGTREDAAGTDPRYDTHSRFTWRSVYNFSKEATRRERSANDLDRHTDIHGKRHRDTDRERHTCQKSTSRHMGQESCQLKGGQTASISMESDHSRSLLGFGLLHRNPIPTQTINTITTCNRDKRQHQDKKSKSTGVSKRSKYGRVRTRKNTCARTQGSRKEGENKQEEQGYEHEQTHGEGKEQEPQ